MPIDLSDIDSEFAIQYNQLCTNISKYDSVLTPDADEVAELKAVNDYIQFVFGINLLVQAYAHSFTSYKNQLHFGPSKGLLSSLPQAPVYPTVPITITNGNAKALYLKFAKECMKNKNFTDAIGIALGLFPATSSAKDPTNITPKLTIKLTTGGHPILHAPKSIYQGYQVWKDVNDGKGYCKLDSSLCADYHDTSDLPVIGTGKVWKYKVIYLLKGAQCGNWSNEVTIGVFGQI